MMAHVVAGGRLKRALEQSAEEAGCAIDYRSTRDKEFNFSVFDGGQHFLAAVVSGESGRAWLEQLDENAVSLPGYALAQLDVGTVEERDGQLLVELEALTVREA